MIEAHLPIPFLREIVIFLAAAGVVVPLLNRLRISPVLGYLLAGSIIGPFGLGVFADTFPAVSLIVLPDSPQIRGLAEVGVMFLLFVIGLELSLERLWASRSLVFGLGALQVAISAAIIGWIATGFGMSRADSIIIGLALALSSTAIVMQILVQKRRLGTTVGRTSFAVLLMQDLAVVPILFVVGVFGAAAGEAGVGQGLAIGLGKAVLTIISIYVVGRIALRPILRQIALVRNAEMFTAATLLIAIGVSVLTALAGLSMALGAFLAGLLLAETEFRAQIEVDIEPFKGLLLGLFFMTVGMGIDWRLVVADPASTLLLVVGLWLLKTTIITGLALLFRRSLPVAVESGVLLGQGGEFAFVILGTASAVGLLVDSRADKLFIVVGLSMFLTPLIAGVGRRASEFVARQLRVNDGQLESQMEEREGHVIIAGFGRVGHTLARLLDTERIEYLALDADAALVSAVRAQGLPVYFGDASRADLLAKAGIEHCSAVVVTMDDPEAASRIVEQIHSRWPTISIHARARDIAHARILSGLGASFCTPEALEASLQLAGEVLLDIGVGDEVVRRRIGEQREFEMN